MGRRGDWRSQVVTRLSCPVEGANGGSRQGPGAVTSWAHPRRKSPCPPFQRRQRGVNCGGEGVEVLWEVAKEKGDEEEAEKIKIRAEGQ